MDTPQLSLRRLRYFIAVAEASSFSRAAERLGMAQPPLSQQVMALEKQLDQRLFVRHARSVELTDAGRALYDLAGPLLDDAAAIPARLARAADGRGGSLCLGFTPAAALHPLLPVALRVFREQEPDINLTFDERDTVPLCDGVAEGRVQVAFIRPPAPVRDRLRVEHLLDEPIVAALPRAHRLADLSAVRLVDLADEDGVMFERSLAPAMYDSILIACKDAGFSPRIVHHAPQKASAMMLAAGGAGITFVPASMTGVHAEALVLKRLDGTHLAAALCMASREREHGVLAGRFRRVVMEHAAALRTDAAALASPRSEPSSDE